MLTPPSDWSLRLEEDMLTPPYPFRPCTATLGRKGVLSISEVIPELNCESHYRVIELKVNVYVIAFIMSLLLALD